MPRYYEAPELREYGSIAALTASFIKCTPGTDSGYRAHDHDMTIHLDDGSPAFSDGSHSDPDSCLPVATLP